MMSVPSWPMRGAWRRRREDPGEVPIESFAREYSQFQLHSKERGRMFYLTWEGIDAKGFTRRGTIFVMQDTELFCKATGRVLDALARWRKMAGSGRAA